MFIELHLPSLNPFRDCRIHLAVVEPTSPMSNSPRGCRTRLVVIKPLSPCSNSFCCGRTHLAVVEPGSTLSSRVVHPPSPSPSIRTLLSQHRRPSLHPLGSPFPGMVGAEGGGVGRYVARTAHVLLASCCFLVVVLASHPRRYLLCRRGCPRR